MSISLTEKKILLMALNKFKAPCCSLYVQVRLTDATIFTDGENKVIPKAELSLEGAEEVMLELQIGPGCIVIQDDRVVLNASHDELRTGTRIVDVTFKGIENSLQPTYDRHPGVSPLSGMTCVPNTFKCEEEVIGALDAVWDGKLLSFMRSFDTGRDFKTFPESNELIGVDFVNKQVLGRLTRISD